MAAGAYGGRRPVLAVEGARELRAGLKRAGVDAAELKSANREAASIVAEEARSTAPDDPFTPDGVHIATTVRPTATKTRAEVRAGNNRKVTYGPTLHYGAYGSRPRAESQPWLTDAAHNTEARWITPYAEHVDQLVARIHGA